MSREALEGLGVKKRIANAIINRREALLESWGRGGPWGAVSGVGIGSWGKIAQRGIEEQSAKIDTVVTTDIHRLMRLAGTLHGKTGLKKTEVPIAGIEDFDPFRNSVAFKRGALTVLVSEAPCFRLGDTLYGPYKDQEVELPTAAALLLLCKKAAKVTEAQ